MIVHFVQNEDPEKLLSLQNVDMANPDHLKSHLAGEKESFHAIYVDMASVNESTIENKLPALLTFLMVHYRFILVPLPQTERELLLKTLRQSDRVYLLIDEDRAHLQAGRSFLKELKTEFHMAENAIRVIGERNNETQTLRRIRRMLGHRLFARLPLDETNERYGSTIRYIARELGDALVGACSKQWRGIWFGAYWCYQSVRNARRFRLILWQAPVLVRLWEHFMRRVSIAKGLKKWALSLKGRRSIFQLIGFRDLAMAHRGFFKGHRITKFLEGWLGKKLTFADMKLPMKVVADQPFLRLKKWCLMRDVWWMRFAPAFLFPGIFRPP